MNIKHFLLLNKKQMPECVLYRKQDLEEFKCHLNGVAAPVCLFVFVCLSVTNVQFQFIIIINISPCKAEHVQTLSAPMRWRHACLHCLHMCLFVAYTLRVSVPPYPLLNLNFHPDMTSSDPKPHIKNGSEGCVLFYLFIFQHLRCVWKGCVFVFFLFEGGEWGSGWNMRLKRLCICCGWVMAWGFVSLSLRVLLPGYSQNKWTIYHQLLSSRSRPRWLHNWPRPHHRGSCPLPGE